ncbi:MAG: tRNA A37 threonylcarbamoyladenosine modification protein TsaB [Pelagibacterales bacterium]|nr:tRNA A37 threonylcarbamoyladenosine modification protein TsaB [Pelagibacterales bacterium]
MNSLVIDAAREKIFLTLISNKHVYTVSHDNSKSNFEKLVVLVFQFLECNKFSINDINKIYVNRGPGSFAGIRNSLSIVKGFFISKNIDYFCFSFEDFGKSNTNKYEYVPHLCDKFKIKKNLINPIYRS